MKIIEYLKLYNYLKNDGLELMHIIRVVSKVRRLPKEYLEAVYLVLEQADPDIRIEEHGVTYKELVEKNSMKPIRAILMLDWIRREPEVAISYMSETMMRAPIEPLDEKEKEELLASIERLQKESGESNDNHMVIDDSKDDIIIM